MTSWFGRVLARLRGTAELPERFDGVLGTDERVLASALSPEGALVATNHGLWIPEPTGSRRIGWHLVNRAVWRDGVLVLTEASEHRSAGGAVLLRDLPRRRFRLESPGRLPDVVHTRVTGSIRSTQYRELPMGGARFVRRRVPGRNGTVLQVRPDRDADERTLAEYADEVARRLADEERGSG
ncbi:hypothetical protein [Actinopolyspora mortivallis]|uniref:Uncharacterized protein n=1 Tax=Actinopolyspora mortivallis TaxID=33906 RepID=A0A2T0GYC9_ACTMO|nr:hypothetical protein [Actinopolyspora mortivallis]PRW64111.1 hypothetical protein CEP50_06825 [Actinopolyspora mortivallis]